MLGHKQPHVAKTQPVNLSLQAGRLAAEVVAVERQGLGRISGAEMHVVESQRFGVFYHLDAGTPRVEDEAHLEQAGHVAKRGPIWKTLHSDP